MIEEVLTSLVGVAIGIIAGIVPSLHINTLLPTLILLSTYFNLKPEVAGILITSIAISEVFVNFISSIFLGAPEDDTSLSVLPGHRLLLQGRGYEAVKLTVIGGIGSLLLSLILIAFSLHFLSFFTKFQGHTYTFSYLQLLGL